MVCGSAKRPPADITRLSLNQNQLSSPIRVTFFGDSICVGQGVSIFRGWVAQIAQDLDSLGEEMGREVLVTNASVNGRTTRQALEDMPYHVQNAGVDIIMVQFGLNDCNCWASDRGLPRVSIDAFKANLFEIAARARRFGAAKVLLNSNHPTSRTKTIMEGASITYEQSNRAYNQAIREVAAREQSQILFQDMEAHFDALVAAGHPIEDYLLQDGLHLSHKGHAQYYSVMQPVIRQAVAAFAA
jgi:acyl-CoA thioesterase-1